MGGSPKCQVVSTHSRLKAAANMATQPNLTQPVSTHSRLKAAGGAHGRLGWPTQFQHTAA